MTNEREALVERHAWVGPYDGAWHCYGCGQTLHDVQSPPQSGCDPISTRARKVADEPGSYARRHLSAVLIEAADRLDLLASAPSAHSAGLIQQWRAEAERLRSAADEARRRGNGSRQAIGTQAAHSFSAATLEACANDLEALSSSVPVETVEAPSVAGMWPWAITSSGREYCFFCRAWRHEKRHAYNCIWQTAQGSTSQAPDVERAVARLTALRQTLRSTPLPGIEATLDGIVDDLTGSARTGTSAPAETQEERAVLVAEHAIKDAFMAGWDAGDSYAFGRYHQRDGLDFEASWEAFITERQKAQPSPETPSPDTCDDLCMIPVDPIAAAVDAQLDPLKDELIAMGRKLAGDEVEGLKGDVRRAEAGYEVVRRKYNELLYAVARKHPGESRHETALRYIRERENQPATGPAAARKATP